MDNPHSRARWLVYTPAMKFRAVVAGVLVVSCALIAGGCGSKTDDGSGVNATAGTGPDGSGGAGGTGNTGIAGTNNGIGNSAGTISLNVDGGDTGGTGSGSGGSPEVCDGLDNNNNGIIDDIDANADGVCDCLLIATLGVKGTWGAGDVFAAWLSARSNNGATDLADQVITPELIAKYQVIVAQDLHQGHMYSDAEVAALQDWVNKGGGLMTLIGYADTSEIMNVNRLLAPFAMNYGNQAILPKRGGNTIPITMWTPHPIDMGVTAVGVDTGCEAQGMGDVIATGGGFDVGRVQTVGMGHVFVWGDEWITYNTEWTQHPDYQLQLFWLNTIKWLTVAGRCQVEIPPNPPT